MRLTFAFARATSAYDYRTFFERLLGPGWIIFEIAYVLFVILILAIFGAAAGAIAVSTLGVSAITGSLLLAACITIVATFGNDSVERLFKYVTFLLYGVYALFVVLAFSKFGAQISDKLALSIPPDGWPLGGLTYASYNVVAAVVILPVLRHLTCQREAVTAGLIAGPLAMLPALLFFVCMIGFYPEIADETLPSDYMLRQLDIPIFHYLFQFMIFAALLESGTGSVHAINERIASVWRKRRGTDLSKRDRAMIASALLMGCIFLADRFGLVALIGGGYRALAYTIIAAYIAPLLTIGVYQLLFSKTVGGMTPDRRRDQE